MANAEKIMRLTAPFAAPGNQTKQNLLHLNSGQIVGDWRDSTYGIGGGRIPFDVNTGLAAPALRGIASLARAGVFDDKQDWASLGDQYADVWENSTLQFFDISRSESVAKALLTNYTTEIDFPGPDQSGELSGPVNFYAIALDGYNDLAKVEVMHSDMCFRAFLIDDTDNAAFMNRTANAVKRTFPAGLLTDVGMLIANPAFGGEPVYAKNWSSNAYQGTVVVSLSGSSLCTFQCTGLNTDVPSRSGPGKWP